MKRIFKYVPGLALAGLLSFTLIPAANAQRGFHAGGIHISAGTGIGGFRAGSFIRGGLNFGFRRGLYVGNTLFYGYPNIGFRFGLLPVGYYPFYWGADLY